MGALLIEGRNKLVSSTFAIRLPVSTRSANVVRSMYLWEITRLIEPAASRGVYDAPDRTGRYPIFRSRCLSSGVPFVEVRTSGSAQFHDVSGAMRNLVQIVIARPVESIRASARLVQEPLVSNAVRILIADDHELVREGMRAILHSEPGWVVCAEATTGREALEQALALKPDVIVLDLALPEMNGVEVTRQVRRMLPATAIVIVTMHDADQVVQEAIDAGASGYVLKADAGRTLKDAVHRILLRGEFISERVRYSARAESSDDQSRVHRQSQRLTSRERQILQLLAEGRANKEIAAALGITTKTAETHRARIMAKLEIHSMSELVRYAIRNRIIEP
jgi:DNA-binding NarL/FixJ family response regulator